MYIEKVLLINFIIDYSIFNVLSLLLKHNVKRSRIILTSLFGEITIVILFLNINIYLVYLIKFFTSILLIYIYNGYKDFKSFMLSFIWFYFLSFILGGLLYYISINYKYYYFIVMLCPIFLYVYKYFIKDMVTNMKHMYKVNIYLNNGKVLYLNGFVDTGNTLVEPYNGNKVIIINKYVDENYYLVPFDTVSGTSTIKCFNPLKVYIDGIGELNNISVGVVNRKFNGYNCLLNYGLWRENE